MKKILLLFCVFANMVNAQNLPDSIYTYNGKNRMLSSGAAISYDKAGRKILEKGIINRNGDDILNEEDQAYKKEYVYIEIENMLKVEETELHLDNEEWKNYSKIVAIYNTSNPNIPVERYDYTIYNEEWLLFANTIGTEYDKMGRPVVLMDTFFNISSLIAEEVIRIEVAYNNDGMPEFTKELMPDIESGNENWIPYRKRENTYDGKKLMKEVYYFHEGDENWTHSYEYVYTYDDNGNITSMIRFDGNFSSETHYKNVYAQEGNSNDAILSVQSNIYPNPVSDVLYVTLEGVDKADITLVNAAGSIMIKQKTSLPAISIPVRSFAKGYYFLIIQTKNGTKTHKVIIR